MRVKVAPGILSLVLMSSTALAETNWVNRFLNRYLPHERRASPVPSQAPVQALRGTVPLTTADLVRLLLENNRDLIVDRTLPLSSAYSIDSFLQPFEPNFHVTGAWANTTSPSSNVLQGAASLLQLTQDYNVGIDQLLQSGTSYSANFEVSRFSSNSVFYVINPSYNGTIRYSVTQHLLRNFGRQINSHAIRIARNNEKISEVQFELQIIDSVAQALQSYWDLVFAFEDVKVKQRSLDLAEKTLHDNRIQVQVGTLAPIDLVQAEAEVATRYEDFITAQYNTAELQDQMKKLISRDTDPGVVLSRLNLIEPLRQPGTEKILTLEQSIQFALENRPELKGADYDVQNQAINIQFTKNQMKPILDVTAGYSHTGLGGTRTLRNGQGGDVIQVIPGGIGDMFSQLFHYTYPGYSAGFNLQIPLKNRAAEADYARALTDHESATTRREAIAQRIAVEVRNAYTQLDMNRARVATARTARELASRRLDAEQTKYDLGTSTVRFVLEEQRNLAQAETNEIQALVNFSKAIVVYDRAIGDTLARNNIEFDKQLPKIPRS